MSLSASQSVSWSVGQSAGHLSKQSDSHISGKWHDTKIKILILHTIRGRFVNLHCYVIEICPAQYCFQAPDKQLKGEDVLLQPPITTCIMWISVSLCSRMSPYVYGAHLNKLPFILFSGSFYSNFFFFFFHIQSDT